MMKFKFFLSIIVFYTMTACAIFQGSPKSMHTMVHPWLEEYPYVNIMEPPPAVPIPGIGIHYVKGLQFDLYLMGEMWYYPEDGSWYGAKHIRGPWSTTKAPPAKLYQIPQPYRKTW